MVQNCNLINEFEFGTQCVPNLENLLMIKLTTQISTLLHHKSAQN